MLKRALTYENFNGEQVTDTLYFNLTSTELISLESSYEGGLEQAIKQIIENENVREIISQFQKIILMAYGQRTEDGKRFIKSDKIKEEFSQTAAYDALFMELASDPEKATIFINAIIPKKLVEEVAKAGPALKSPSAPRPPVD